MPVFYEKLRIMNTFTPLINLNGIDAELFCKKIRNKQIIIWGAGIFGKNIIRILNKFILTEEILFCDSNKLLINTEINGTKII